MTMNFGVYVGIGLQLLCYTQRTGTMECVYPSLWPGLIKAIKGEMKKVLSPTVVSTNIK